MKLGNLVYRPTLMSTTTRDDQAEGRIPADTFAIRLVILRHELRLTVDEISSMCGIASATWSTWEHGTRPRDKTEAVLAISEGTGYDRDWLMWGSGFPLRRNWEPFDDEIDRCRQQLKLPELLLCVA